PATFAGLAGGGIGRVGSGSPGLRQVRPGEAGCCYPSPVRRVNAVHKRSGSASPVPFGVSDSSASAGWALGRAKGEVPHDAFPDQDAPTSPRGVMMSPGVPTPTVPRGYHHGSNPKEAPVGRRKEAAPQGPSTQDRRPPPSSSVGRKPGSPLTVVAL